MPIECTEIVFHRILEISKKAGCLSEPFFIGGMGEKIGQTEAILRRHAGGGGKRPIGN